MVTLNMPIRIGVDYAGEVMPGRYVIVMHFSSSIMGTITGTIGRRRCLSNLASARRLLLCCGKTRNKMPPTKGTLSPNPAVVLKVF
jgi:hypothetical protein